MDDRRTFLKNASLMAASSVAAQAQASANQAGSTSRGADAGKPVRIAFLGTGNRGTTLLRYVLRIPFAQVTAVCDLDDAAAARAAKMVTDSGRPKPVIVSGSTDAWKPLIDRQDVDAVVIAAPWDYHVPMALAAMRAGKVAGIEVPAAQSTEHCWELLETEEKTGVPCMMLENWSFRRDNLAVLNMIRLGLLGEIVHCHAAHGNDCVNRIPWYFQRDGQPRWGGEYLVNRNCDQYPTHSLGPVFSWMNINTGDALDSIISITNRSLGINHFFAETLGRDHPAATKHYAQGDIATSLIKTKNGNTIVLNNDMQLPRPYDNRWMIQGTEGVYSEERNSIYLWRISPKAHEWEPFAPYQEKYDHKWWKPVKSAGGSDQLAGGHGGTDPLLMYQFLTAVRDKTTMPVDVYDSLAMSVVVDLSRRSIAANSAQLSFPDFTRGAWKTRKPHFALDQGVGA